MVTEESARVPRRQPAYTPSRVPTMNAKIVVAPTRTSVQGSALPIVCATVSVGNEYDRPNLSCAMFFR